MPSLNLNGLKCPMPIIKISRAIREIPVGQTLDGVANEAGFQPDVQAWCRSTGHELVSLDKTGLEFHFVIRRTK